MKVLLGVLTIVVGGSGGVGLNTSIPPPVAMSSALHVTCWSTEEFGPTVVGALQFT
jgi:hypothetical protein